MLEVGLFYAIEKKKISGGTMYAVVGFREDTNYKTPLHSYCKKVGGVGSHVK